MNADEESGRGSDSSGHALRSAMVMPILAGGGCDARPEVQEREYQRFGELCERRAHHGRRGALDEGFETLARNGRSIKAPKYRGRRSEEGATSAVIQRGSWGHLSLCAHGRALGVITRWTRETTHTPMSQHSQSRFPQGDSLTVAATRSPSGRSRCCVAIGKAFTLSVGG